MADARTRQHCEVFGRLPHLAPDRPRRREDPNHLSAASNQAGDPAQRQPGIASVFELNEQVQAYLSEKADGKGISLNDLLRREVEIIEAVK